MRRPSQEPNIPLGLEQGTMFRIPREFCVGDYAMDLHLCEELWQWLSDRNDPENPTHRIIFSWGVIIEFFDDEFKFEYMLRWSTQAEWPEILEKKEQK